MEHIKLYNEDCFEAFKKVKDKSVNLFLLDLPYGQTACKWDSVIDLEKMWKEIKRTLVKEGIVVMFCTTKFGFTLIQSNPKWFKYDLVWKKSKKVGFLSANKMPLRQHEMMYVFKEKQGTYNPQKVEGKPYDRTPVDSKNYGKEFNDCYYGKTPTKFKPVKNDGYRHPTSIVEKEADHEMMYVFKEKQGTYNPQKEEGKPYKTKGHDTENYYRKDGVNVKIIETDNKGDRHPTSIVDDITIDVENTVLDFKSVNKTVHKTQKPVDLCEWLIKSYSNEGDTVMDFCMGSGTTGVACKNTKRKFIGVELDKEIFEVAKERIEL
jgi:site-specific DNA-methyltransferase (adenine-specific)